jgi:tetratricopeptide (TPR) repeat protein
MKIIIQMKSIISQKYIISVYFLLMFGLLINQNSYCQNNKSTNQKDKIEKEEITADKIDALNELAWKLRFDDPQKAYKYGKEAGDMSKDLGYNIGALKAFINIGFIFILSKNDFENASICFKRADKILDKLSDENDEKKYEAQICEGYGIINYKLHDYELAIKNYQKAILLYRQVSQGYDISNCFHSIGMIYKKIGDRKKADQAFHKEIVNTQNMNKKYCRKNSVMPEMDSVFVTIEDVDGNSSVSNSEEEDSIDSSND